MSRQCVGAFICLGDVTLARLTSLLLWHESELCPMWPSQESVDPSVPIPSVTKLEGKTDRGTKLGLTK